MLLWLDKKQWTNPMRCTGPASPSVVLFSRECPACHVQPNFDPPCNKLGLFDDRYKIETLPLPSFFFFPLNMVFDEGEKFEPIFLYSTLQSDYHRHSFHIQLLVVENFFLLISLLYHFPLLSFAFFSFLLQGGFCLRLCLFKQAFTPGRAAKANFTLIWVWCNWTALYHQVLSFTSLPFTRW